MFRFYEIVVHRHVRIFSILCEFLKVLSSVSIKNNSLIISLYYIVRNEKFPILSWCNALTLSSFFQGEGACWCAGGCCWSQPRSRPRSRLAPLVTIQESRQTILDIPASQHIQAWRRPSPRRAQLLHRHRVWKMFAGSFAIYIFDTFNTISWKVFN